MVVTLFDTPLSGFWNIWVIALITINLVLLVWLIIWTQKIPAGEARRDDDTTGHECDEISELNSPLPRWWLFLFYGTIIFAVVYFILYPGFGNFKGILGWTQESRLADKVGEYNQKYAPIYEHFAKMSVVDISKDETGLRIGERLFSTNCSVCHGTTAEGTKGFPNLTDSDWLYGGDPNAIEQSILNGRGGVMPAYGGIPLNSQKLNEVANYVLSLGKGREHDKVKAVRGKASFAICRACHGFNGKGNKALGAPNLTDDIWLHGRSLVAIKGSIKTGFDGQKNRMPAFKDFLGTDKVRILAGYVYSLSNK